MEAIKIISLLGLIQGALISAALLAKGTNPNQARRLLAVMMLFITVFLTELWLEMTGLLFSYPHLFGVGFFLEFGFAPILYFYTRTLTEPSFQLNRHSLIHLLPMALSFIIYIPFWFSGAQFKLSILTWLIQQNTAVEFPQHIKLGLIHPVLAAIQMAAYSIVIVKRLGNYHSRVRESYSSIERLNLSWLLYLCLCCLCLLVAYTLILFVPIVLGNAPDRELFYKVSLLFVAIIYSVSYIGFRQPSILQFQATQLLQNDSITESMATLPNAHSNPAQEKKPIPIISNNTITTNNTKQSNNTKTDKPPPSDTTISPQTTNKYQKSGLSEELAAALKPMLLEAMENEKIYRHNNLTLMELSEHLGYSANHISQTINSQFQQNFFDFINSYRIAEAKALLLDLHNNFSVIDIAMQSGFNSKSSFYTAFKKNTGITPSQFKQKFSSVPS